METKSSEDKQYYNHQMMSPEIVEIGDDIKSSICSRDEGIADVYVAVGKNDLDVIRWVLNHAVLPGSRVFLVHVYPPIAYIPTPVGRLTSSQLSNEQVQIYIKEENNKRRNLLQKYINLCTDARVPVDTMLVESNAVTKAVLDLIPVLNITNLVMGTKRPPIRLIKKSAGKAQHVQKSAPEYCEVTIVYDGKKVVDGDDQKVVDGKQQQSNEGVSSIVASDRRKSKSAQQPPRTFLDCICFSGKFS
ncbi:U-box domain-containing protein 36-like [Apium graveolens]|uniref:U-box domain-containing protein 36-like n=1 Tax=Apium graveolens TaxID=4045 RepID=UPI003D7AAA91